MTRPMLSLIALAGLVACGGSVERAALYEATNTEAELSLTPANPLIIPSALTLPQPTPGGVNRAMTDTIRDLPLPE